MKKLIVVLSLVLLGLGVGAYYFLTHKPVRKSSLDIAFDAVFKAPAPSANAAASSSSRKSDQVFANPITLSECRELFAKNNSINQMEARKRLAIAKALAELKELRAFSPELGILADLSGMKKGDLKYAARHAGRYYREGGPKTDIFTLGDKDEERISLSDDGIKLVRSAEKTKDYSEVERAVKSKSIDPNATHGAKSLLAIFIYANNEITVGEVEKLIAAGLPVKPDALAYGIAKGLSLDHIKVLVDANPETVNKSWLDDSTSSNAMITSAKYLRADLYQYFSDKGGSVVAESRAFGGQTVLDALPNPQNEKERLIAEKIATSALSQNVRAMKYATKNRLESILPLEAIQQYSSLLEPERALDPKLKEKADQLKHLVASSSVSISLAKRDMDSCAEQHEYSIDNYFAEISQSKVNLAEMSLETKAEYIKYFQRELRKKPWLNVSPALTSVFEGMRNYPNQDELKAIFSNYNELLKNKNWDGAVAAAEDMRVKNQVSGLERVGYSYLINAYLKETNPDSQFVQKLLKEGAVLDFSDIQDAINRNSLGALKNFKQYGLDLNSPNRLNQNALDFAVSRMPSLETVDFLIENGVAVKSNTLGLDALDRALENMEMYNSLMEDSSFLNLIALRGNGGFVNRLKETPQVVDHLIRAGAPIEQSHIDQIIILKATNPDAYAKLLQIIPNLENLLPTG